MNKTIEELQQEREALKKQGDEIIKEVGKLLHKTEELLKESALTLEQVNEKEENNDEDEEIDTTVSITIPRAMQTTFRDLGYNLGLSTDNLINMAITYFIRFIEKEYILLKNLGYYSSQNNSAKTYLDLQRNLFDEFMSQIIDKNIMYSTTFKAELSTSNFEQLKREKMLDDVSLVITIGAELIHRQLICSLDIEEVLFIDFDDMFFGEI